MPDSPTFNTLAEIGVQEIGKTRTRIAQIRGDGKFGSALKVLNQALRAHETAPVDPESDLGQTIKSRMAELYTLKGDILAEDMHERFKAVRQYRNALNLDPSDQKTWEVMTDCAYYAKHPKFLEIAEEAAQKNPTSVVIARHRATVMIFADQTEEALQALLPAIAGPKLSSAPIQIREEAVSLYLALFNDDEASRLARNLHGTLGIPMVNRCMERRNTLVEGVPALRKNNTSGVGAVPNSLDRPVAW